MNGAEVIEAMRKHCERQIAHIQEEIVEAEKSMKEIGRSIAKDKVLNTARLYFLARYVIPSCDDQIDNCRNMLCLIKKLQQQLTTYIVTENNKGELIPIETDKCIMFENDNQFDWAREVLDFARQNKELMSELIHSESFREMVKEQDNDD